MDRWEDHVKKWRKWATDRGMATEFVLWGESELLSRLSHDAHRGRRFFWFNEETFSQDWFKHQINESVANAGPRYTPELNVDLPVARVFDGLCRTPEFYVRLKRLFGEIRRRNERCYPHNPPPELHLHFDELRHTTGRLIRGLGGVRENDSELIDFGSLTSQGKDCFPTLASCEKALREYKEPAAAAPESAPKEPKQAYQPTRDFKNYIYELDKLWESLRDLEAMAESKESLLANLPAMVLVGAAGMGKTHLLCDIARKHIDSGQPAVLFLGELFTEEEPWAQILKLLGLRCSRDEFLGALDAAGEAAGLRALLVIDALNEGDGTRLWKRHLAGMLDVLARYKRIGVCLSVRTSYESTVIPPELIPAKLIPVIHQGFATHEYQATRTFFDHFGIQHPAVPMLVPEFHNPLFLKVFCKALQNKGMTRIPPGLRGITTLLEFFLDGINEKLSGPERLDFDPTNRVVNRAVETIARMMAETGTSHVKREEASEKINALLPRPSHSHSLFRAMISEGLLAEERHLTELPDTYEDVIRFAYERFTDHLITKYLLDTHANSTAPAEAFAHGRVLGSLLDDEPACWKNRGLIDALCIQVPERFAKELPEFAERAAGFRPLREAFVDSLIWRDPRAIRDGTLKYINDHVVRHSATETGFLDALLTIAPYPDHPYNAHFLHRHLMKFEMAVRDSWWSTFLQYDYGDGGVVDRLIDWAWLSESRSQVTDESLELAATALIWFLTSSNRYLRDRTTKALVSLLTPRIHIVRKLLEAIAQPSARRS